MSDLSELFEQLADGPVLLVTDSVSVNADCDNGTTLSCMRGSRTYHERDPRGTLTHTGQMPQNVHAGKGKCAVRQTIFGGGAS